MPRPARTAVTNFFSNLNDPWVALNQLMQGKVRLAIDDFGRFVWNSTFGLLGLIDVATDMGLQKHNEDFGQTLGRMGRRHRAVLRAADPRTEQRAGRQRGSWSMRSRTCRGGSEMGRFRHRVTWQWSLTGFDLVQTRANLLDASNILEEAALDKYAFVRDAYLQRRRNLIYDGDPPPAGRNRQSRRRRSRGARPARAPLARRAGSVADRGARRSQRAVRSRARTCRMLPGLPSQRRWTEVGRPRNRQVDAEPPSGARAGERDPTLAAPASIGPARRTEDPRQLCGRVPRRPAGTARVAVAVTATIGRYEPCWLLAFARALRRSRSPRTSRPTSW